MRIVRRQMVEIEQLNKSAPEARTQLSGAEQKALDAMLGALGKEELDLPDFSESQLEALKAKLHQPSSGISKGAAVAQEALQPAADSKAPAIVPRPVVAPPLVAAPAKDLSMEKPLQYPQKSPHDFVGTIEPLVKSQRAATAKSMHNMKILLGVGLIGSLALVGIPFAIYAAYRLFQIKKVEQASENWLQGLMAFQNMNWDKAISCFKALEDDDMRMFIDGLKSYEEFAGPARERNVLKKEAMLDKSSSDIHHAWLISTAYVNAALEKIKKGKASPEEIRLAGVRAQAYLSNVRGDAGFLNDLARAMEKMPTQIKVI